VIIENNYRNMGKLDDIVLDQLPDQEHLIKVDIAGNVWVEVIDQYHDEPLLKAVYYRQVDKALQSAPGNGCGAAIKSKG
jgi:hypothetical protein